MEFITNDMKKITFTTIFEHTILAGLYLIGLITDLVCNFLVDLFSVNNNEKQFESFV